MVRLDWETAIDPEQDRDTYTLQVATDAAFTDVIHRREQLTASTAVIPFGVLKNQRTYYWRVTAVDAFGAVTLSSQTFHFVTLERRTVSGVLQGIVYSDLDLVSLATVTLTQLDNQVVTTTDVDGSFAVDVDPGIYSLSVSGDEIATKTLDAVAITATEPQTLNLQVQAITGQIDIDADALVSLQNDGYLLLRDLLFRELFGPDYLASLLIGGLTSSVGADRWDEPAEIKAYLESLRRDSSSIINCTVCTWRR